MKLPSIALVIALAVFTSANRIHAQGATNPASTRGVTADLVIGTVAAFNRTSKTISVITADGVQESFDLDDHCTLDTAAGVQKAAMTSGRALKKGGLVVLYFKDENGHAVVRAIDEISHGA